MNKLTGIAFIICLLFSTPLLALKCGRSIVNVGDYKEDVIDQCGYPDSVQSHYERRSNQNRADVSQYNFNNHRRFPSGSFNYGQSYYQDVEVLVEEWIYNFGSARLKKMLRFENGKLVEIKSLGRGRYRR
jgi:Protein of unknown function (DUF2845)